MSIIGATFEREQYEAVVYPDGSYIVNLGDRRVASGVGSSAEVAEIRARREIANDKAARAEAEALNRPVKVITVRA